MKEQTPSKKQSSRRNFLKDGVLGIGGSILAASLLLPAEYEAPKAMEIGPKPLAICVEPGDGPLEICQAPGSYPTINKSKSCNPTGNSPDAACTRPGTIPSTC